MSDDMREAIENRRKVCPILRCECLRGSCEMWVDYGGELDGRHRCALHHLGMMAAGQLHNRRR